MVVTAIGTFPMIARDVAGTRIGDVVDHDRLRQINHQGQSHATGVHLPAVADPTLLHAEEHLPQDSVGRERDQDLPEAMPTALDKTEVVIVNIALALPANLALYLPIGARQRQRGEGDQSLGVSRRRDGGADHHHLGQVVGLGLAAETEALQYESNTDDGIAMRRKILNRREMIARTAADAVAGRERRRAEGEIVPLLLQTFLDVQNQLMIWKMTARHHEGIDRGKWERKRLYLGRW